MDRLQGFINVRKQFEKQLPDFSVSPLELLRKKELETHSFDTELVNLYHVNKPDAGYAPPVFNPKTKKFSSPGSKMLEVADMVQFAVSRKKYGKNEQRDTLLNLYRRPQELQNANWWEGSTDVRDFIFDPKNTQGKSPAEFAQGVRNYFNSLSVRNKSVLLVGYNAINADKEWMRQFGAHMPNNIHYVDVMDMARIAFPREGFAGGMQLESLKQVLLKHHPEIKGLTSHTAQDDATTTSALFDYIISEPHWTTMSSSQKQAINKLLSPFVHEMPGFRGKTLSDTLDFFQAASYDDPHLLSQFKLDNAKVLFKTGAGDPTVLDQIYHSGSKAGKKRIIEALGAIDKDTVTEFRKLHGQLRKYSKGRLEFVLQRRNNLDYLYLAATDQAYNAKNASRNIIAHTAIPLQQALSVGQKTLVTLGDNQYGVRGGFLESTTAGFKKRSYTSLFFQAMSRGLHEEKKGGIVVSDLLTNLGPKLLRSIVANAERMNIFASTKGDDIGFGTVRYDSTGKLLSSSALKTALIEIGSMEGTRAGTLAALEKDLQFLLNNVDDKVWTSRKLKEEVLKSAEIPEFAEINNVFYRMNIARALAVRQGKGAVADSDMPALKKAAAAILSLFKTPGLKDLGLSFFGIKPESLMRGIVSSDGGIHYGRTKRTGPKGSFELRSIKPFGESKRQNIIPAQMVPRGLIGGLKTANERGLDYIPGRVVSFGIIQTNDVSGKIAANLYGGDASIIATRRGLNNLRSTVSSQKIFVTDLHTDLLNKLTDSEKQSLFRERGKLKFFNDRNRALSLAQNDNLGIVYKGGVAQNITFQNNIKGEFNRLVGISTVRGQQGYYLEFGAQRARGHDSVGRSVILGGLRSTISRVLKNHGEFENVDFIGYDEFNKPADLVYQHIISRIHKGNKAEEFKNFLEKKLGTQIESFKDTKGKIFYETPDVDASRLEELGTEFARINNININPDVVTLEGKRAKARGVPSGTKMAIYDSIIHERAGERDDIGKKVGGALRIRLKDAEEARIRALASGFTGVSASGEAIERIFNKNAQSAKHFRTYINYLRKGGNFTAAEYAAQGIKVYTLDDIRKGALKGTNVSGFLTRDSIKDTVLDIHRNSLFAIDLGDHIGAIPLGKGSKKGDYVTARALQKRRVLLMPSAKMAGFGLSSGATKISGSDIFASFIEGINLLADASVDPLAAVHKFYVGYGKFHKALYGKDALYEKHGIKSKGIKQSGQFRNILSTRSRNLNKLTSGRAIGTVELEEGYIRRHAGELGLSTDYLERIKSGRAYGLATVNPHASLHHSALVRFIFRQGSEESYSPNIGTHAFLSKMFRRDYDKDKIFTLFFDRKGKKKEVDAFHKALESEWKHLSKTTYTNLSINNLEALKRQFKIEQAKSGGGNIDYNDPEQLAKALADYVGSKGLAPSPHLRIKGEEIFLGDYRKLIDDDPDVIKQNIKKEIFRGFGLSSGEARSSAAIDLAAEFFGIKDQNRLANRYQNWAVFQEELYQQALQKAGPLKEAANTFGDIISGLQVDVWNALQNNKANVDPDFIKQIHSEILGKSKQAAKDFMTTVESEKGLMNLGGAINFGDPKQIESLIDDFSSQQSIMHLLYGTHAFEAAGGDPDKMTFYLGRTHSLRKLIKKTASNDQMDVLFRNLGEADDNFNFQSFGVDAGQAESSFSSFIQTQIDNMAEGAAAQIKAGGKRALPFAESIEKAGEALGSSIMKGGSNIIDFLKGMPAPAKAAAGLIAGYAAYSEFTSGGAGDLGELNAPSIDSSRVMRASIPKTPMVSTPDVRYPDPINPASYRGKALMQRNAPMIQFHGRQLSNNPYGSAMDLADTIGSANIANGQINIYDNRSHSDMQSQFAARDAIASDY